MASANTGLQITNLDFTSIKSSLKTFLQQQDTLKDYNFDGSALSVLVDLLAYNTQYNAYYLNMVANEMFLDSAIQRGSVVSHAKLLNYVPKSSTAPKAKIKLTVNEVTAPTLTLPKNTPFISEAIDSVNYTFVTPTSTTVTVTANTAVFDNVSIIQGTTASYSYTVDKTSNPSLTFEIPDQNIDTSTLVVNVYESSTNTTYQTFTQSDNYSQLNSASKVYFVQEGIKGLYEIYFGDGILGSTLNDGNIVALNYINTNGTSSYGANSFVLMSPIGGYSNTVTTSIESATQGSGKESITSIKYTAPKAYSAQGRAVTKDDYITQIKNNKLGYAIDAINVWGGEENNPPVYGQIFVAVKPAGGYTLTPTQKQNLITSVIKPISVLTVQPTIVDPDYTYIKVTSDVLYDVKKTTATLDQVKNQVSASISSFSVSTLNTFNSVFMLPELITTIQNANQAIITNDTSIRLQKKIYPTTSVGATYVMRFGVPLKRDYFTAGVTSSPSMQYRDTITGTSAIRDGVFIEEVPTFTAGIGSISVTNPGYGYTETPIVTITGDGTGAAAHAILNSGRVVSIVVDNAGINYTQAIVTITRTSNDTTGALAAGVANLAGSIGTLRLYYYSNNTKIILNNNIGTVDYTNGIVTLNNFNPYSINNDLGQLTITATPLTNIVESSYNRIITVDPFDSGAITVNVTAKT
jgi:hypothetical protein